MLKNWQNTDDSLDRANLIKIKSMIYCLKYFASYSWILIFVGSFNETPAVSGKRLKKPPQRFELQPTEKRKSSVDDGKGRGELLGNIRWSKQSAIFYFYLIEEIT